MMQGILRALLTIGLLAGGLANAAATERGTADEAKAMVARAIALYREKGAAEAFAIMNRPNGGFRDRDLYIFVYGADRKVVVQAVDATRIGLDADSVRDADGKYYGKESLAAATPQGVWVDYRRANPANGQIEQKSSWLVRVDGYVFGCGIYKP
jgi:signal transduction histidine kinase